MLSVNAGFVKSLLLTNTFIIIVMVKLYDCLEGKNIRYENPSIVKN